MDLKKNIYIIIINIFYSELWKINERANNTNMLLLANLILCRNAYAHSDIMALRISCTSVGILIADLIASLLIFLIRMLKSI